MSEQREMTLDEYLESKLPDFHLARCQLQELREERDALAAHLERMRTSLELAKSRIGLLADVATRYGAAVHAAIDIWPVEMDKVIEQSPETSLARVRGEVRHQVAEEWELGLPRLKAEWQAEALEHAADNIAPVFRRELKAWASEKRRQAEGGE